MTVTTIATVLHDPGHDHHALDYAIELARAFEAHLSICVIGIDQTDPGFYYADATPLALTQNLQSAKNQAREVEESLKGKTNLIGTKHDIEVVTLRAGNLTGFIADRTRFCDLVVLPTPYSEAAGSEDVAILEAALLQARMPVLVVPDGVKFDGFAENVLVAWNESPEALNAIRAAFPFLRRASNTEIAIFDPPQHGPGRSDPGGRLAQLIVRHGGHANISVLAKTESSLAPLILQRARDCKAKLIAMGGYGHSRLREAIIGGATRDMLKYATLPVLMAH